MKHFTAHLILIFYCMLHTCHARDTALDRLTGIYAPPSLIKKQVNGLYELYDTVKGLDTELLFSMIKSGPKMPCLADIMAAVDALADKDMEALACK